MSSEIRHFLIFVEQDRSSDRPLPDDNVPLPFSSALKAHFGGCVEEERSPAATDDRGRLPVGSAVALGPR